MSLFEIGLLLISFGAVLMFSIWLLRKPTEEEPHALSGMVTVNEYLIKSLVNSADNTQVEHRQAIEGLTRAVDHMSTRLDSVERYSQVQVRDQARRDEVMDDIDSYMAEMKKIILEQKH